MEPFFPRACAPGQQLKSAIGSCAKYEWPVRKQANQVTKVIKVIERERTSWLAPCRTLKQASIMAPDQPDKAVCGRKERMESERGA